MGAADPRRSVARRGLCHRRYDENPAGGASAVLRGGHPRHPRHVLPLRHRHDLRAQVPAEKQEILLLQLLIQVSKSY